MKLIGTEIDAHGMQLTYTDGRAVPESAELLIVRLPLQGSLKRSIMWHQFNVLDRAVDALMEERGRVREELEKND